jgi:electron transport complex protein RnfD
MLDVILALVPAAVASVYFFGSRVLLIMGVSVASAVLTEAIIRFLRKKPITISDLSAVVTGLLLSYTLPSTVPLWIPAVGSFAAIALVKQAFGGLGQNFMNPALAARAILFAAWPMHMIMYAMPGVDGMTTATPLAILKAGENELPSLWNAFVGNIGGSVGETSALALLLGASYLFYRRVINWRIPFAFIGTVGLLTWILGPEGFFTGKGLYSIFLGGLILGAFFMATDYVSSPLTPKGKIIMGIGCGILTVVIRLYGGYPEGVSYAILIMNLLVPLIDRYTVPRVFGEEKKKWAT